MFTMCAIPRAFEGLHAIWQENAIASWTQLRPKPEIILFGDEAGIAEIAAKYACRHIKHIAANKYGTPLLSDAFTKVRAKAQNPLICYSNADIIFTKGLIEATKKCQETFEQFLLVGRRLDSDIKFKVKFQGKWQQATWNYARDHGRHHSPRGVDYFVFTKDLYQNVPPFAVGRTAWDNWLVLNVTRREIPTIDATPIIQAIHQGKSKRTPLPKAERNQNQSIWTRNGGVKDGGYTTSTTWLLDENGFHLKEKRSPWR